MQKAIILKDTMKKFKNILSVIIVITSILSLVSLFIVYCNETLVEALKYGGIVTVGTLIIVLILWAWIHFFEMDH
jgi:hypothetical protein